MEARESARSAGRQVGTPTRRALRTLNFARNRLLVEALRVTFGDDLEWGIHIHLPARVASRNEPAVALAGHSVRVWRCIRQARAHGVTRP